ncbi:ATP-binding protein [Chloroflexota bacterium]
MWQVTGHSRAVSLLQRSLETGSLAHAYLFIGPAHVGKMALAINLAQALNCEAAEPPCGQCPPCERIASAKHADVQIIGLSLNDDSAESKSRAEISIDQIRNIQHSASLPPFEGRYRVYIIDGAELLSLEAANCLLKTLEEPTGKVVFVLLTTSERLLPKTVVSRCQTVELSPVPAGEIETFLIDSRGVEPEKAKLLAKLSHGCPSWAVSAAVDDSLLEQRAELLDRMVETINTNCDERFTYTAQLATRYSQNRGLVHERLDLWLDWWRDLLLVKAGSANNITNIDRADSLARMAAGFSLAQIRDVIENIRAAGEQLRQNANPQLVLEVLMLGIPDSRNVEQISIA